MGFSGYFRFYKTWKPRFLKTQFYTAAVKNRIGVHHTTQTVVVVIGNVTVVSLLIRKLIVIGRASTSTVVVPVGMRLSHVDTIAHPGLHWPTIQSVQLADP